MTPEQIEFSNKLKDPIWRLNNLYKIIIKGDGEEEGLVIQFKMNRAQVRFIKRHEVIFDFTENVYRVFLRFVK